MSGRRLFLGALVLFAALLGAALTWVDRVLIPALDAELVGLESWRPPTTVRVLDKDGQVVDRFFLVRRIWVPIDELPAALLDAVVAAEDRRFFHHAGLDVRGILRALASNALAGRVREGGSSITQQVVKNAILGHERTLGRKLREALLALRLEQRMTKRQILELYLNLIYLGSGNHGVEAAARDYFGVSARSVDLAQAALLASLIPAPSRFSPRNDPERAMKRRNRVLATLGALGWASDAEIEAAKKSGLAPPPREDRSQLGAEAFLTEVRREVRRLLGEEVPFEAGLRVHTSLDLGVQKIAEAAVRAAAEAVEARQGIRLNHRLRPDERIPDEAPLRPGDCAEVVSLGGSALSRGEDRHAMDPSAWRLRIFNPDPDEGPLTLAASLHPGDRFDACMTDKGTLIPAAGLDLDGDGAAGRPYVEGAAIVLEHATGRLVALVGGRDMPLEGFHRATQARRQAGSAFKPFVYGSAIDLGMSQLDVVLDAPLSLDAGADRLWEPKNASRGFWGLVALRWAFAYSLNTAAVRLVMLHGTAPVIDRARAAGISTPLRRDLTMALGTSEVRPIELVAGIAGIVRGGVAIEPTLIDRLVDLRGQEVARAGERIRLPGVSARLPGGESSRFLKPGSAWEVVDMMRAVIERGTGRAAAKPAEDRGGKTGTSSGYRDAWFVGFTPTHVIGVWLGQDDGATLGRGESGDRAALPAWKEIADALSGGPALTPPPDVIPIQLGDTWVDVSAENVPTSRLGWRVPPLPDPLPAAPEPPDCRRILERVR